MTTEIEELKALNLQLRLEATQARFNLEAFIQFTDNLLILHEKEVAAFLDAIPDQERRQGATLREQFERERKEGIESYTQALRERFARSTK